MTAVLDHSRRLLERVQRARDEVLLVERVGVSRVAVLERGGLQEARPPAGCRRPARRRSRSGRTGGWPGRSSRSSRPRSAAGGGVGRRGVVLERLVVLDVVADDALATLWCELLQVALPLAVDRGRLEAALEPAPADAVRRSAGRRRSCRESWHAVRVRAVVELGLRVADDRVVLDRRGRSARRCRASGRETRLIAPTVDGPKFVPNELSLIAKFWARFHSPVTVLPS